MYHQKRRHFVAALLLVIGLLVPITGCGRHGESANSESEPGKLTVIRIGHQKADGSHLTKLRGDLEKRLAAEGIKVEWLEFPAGPPLLEALGAGSIDFGSTGDSPALFAQAAGNPLVYIANIPLPPEALNAEAILVPKNSPIRTVADLKGKRVAFAKASGSHNMVLQVIEKAGLKYSEIQPVYLAPPDARVAFEGGSIDAWGIWDPYLAAAQDKLGARVLANKKGVITAGSFYLSSRAFATAHPEVLRTVLEEIDRASVWASSHQQEAAELLAKNTGIDIKVLELLQSRRPKGSRNVGIHPIDDKVLDAQQTVADSFTRIGLLPKKINVREATLSKELYAKITPGIVNSPADKPVTTVSSTKTPANPEVTR